MKKALRIIGVVAVVVAVIGAIIASLTTKPSNSESVWDKDMTMGNLDAKNYYIIYSDLACPYCIFFENPIVENEEAFKEYIEEKDILIEVRLSDFLYEYGEHQSPASRYGAIASYCAKNEGRFWDYYNLAVHRMYKDYFEDAGKSGLNALDREGKDLWIGYGKTIGLGETFENCVENEDPLELIKERALKTTKLVNGMPYFKFNSYVFSGFTPNGYYSDVMTYMEAGLKSK